MSRRRVRPQPTPSPGWTIVDGHEPSAWLRDAAATRLRAIAGDKRVQTVASEVELIVCPLSGNFTKSASREDYTCDRCRRYCAADGFHTFGLHFRATMPGVPDVVLAGGLCDDCAARETMPELPSQSTQPNPRSTDL